MEDKLYELYLETYGKVKSGKVIEKGDYEKWNSEEEKQEDRPLQEKLAITLGIEHAKGESDFLSKADFEKALRKLSGSEGEE